MSNTFTGLYVRGSTARDKKTNALVKVSQVFSLAHPMDYRIYFPEGWINDRGNVIGIGYSENVPETDLIPEI